MAGLQRFRTLEEREKAVICIGILLDGFDAPDFLAADKGRGTALVRAAGDFAQLPPNVRIPLAGSTLRGVIKNLRSGGKDKDKT